MEKTSARDGSGDSPRMGFLYEGHRELLEEQVWWWSSQRSEHGENPAPSTRLSTNPCPRDCSLHRGKSKHLSVIWGHTVPSPAVLLLPKPSGKFRGFFYKITRHVALVFFAFNHNTFTCHYLHVQLHQHNWNTARNLSSYVTVHTFMYKLQRCQKIPPSTVVGNTISNAGGKVLIVIDYSAKHQYTDTIATPGRAPAHLISIKISKVSNGTGARCRLLWLCSLCWLWGKKQDRDTLRAFPHFLHDELNADLKGEVQFIPLPEHN